MLDLTLTAHETALITQALYLVKDQLQTEKMRREIIDAWVSQNPDHADLPWLQL